MEEQARELRRIRITLIFLVIVTLISGGNSDVSVDYLGDDNEMEISQQNVVPLGDGRFGVIEYNYLEIYEYDSEHNKVKKVKEVSLDELNE
ncbi:YmzC family protein [Siminovitchia fortis]|uniref:Uncharacterized protein n=1 Tax=Siminovitchia fortis TaxID=254758 RepID=A0A443IXS8_9BACI|nr:YmzC family protein [Siminovitchia fortis]RWR12892.1 hypothetical protein D4N35_005805 [Siminovitchia fortis]WHY80449.1 YmzC family protein [Siminovitchia fortis]